MSSVQSRRRIHCPVELDIMIAEIQGELPLDERRDLRAHLNTCALCQARLDQLRAAYQRIATLNDVPVMPVASLRESVLHESVGRLRSRRMSRGLNLSGRTLLLLAIGLIVVVGLVILAITGPLLRGKILATTRSRNSLTKLAPIGTGTLFAETVKLIPVRVSGTTWDLGEVVGLDQATGQVVMSLPASTLTPFVPRLGIGSGTNIRPAVSPDGKTLVEVAISGDGRSPTAFAAVDVATGAVRYIQTIGLPAGVPAQAQPVIRQLWIAPDNATVYVLTDLTVNGTRGAYILSFDLATGHEGATMIPPADATGPGLGGTALVLAPDGAYFYDAQPAQDVSGHAGVLISFVAVAQQRVATTLFVPGNFAIMSMAISADGQTLAVFSANEATVTLIATVTQTVTNTIILGANDNDHFTAADASAISVNMAFSHAGTTLYVERNIALPARRSFDLWGVNLTTGTFSSLTQVTNPIQRVVFSNDDTNLILLRANGTMDTLNAVTPQLPTPWVSLQGNTPVTQLARQ